MMPNRLLEAPYDDQNGIICAGPGIGQGRQHLPAARGMPAVS